MDHLDGHLITGKSREGAQRERLIVKEGKKGRKKNREDFTLSGSFETVIASQVKKTERALERERERRKVREGEKGRKRRRRLQHEIFNLDGNFITGKNNER